MLLFYGVLSFSVAQRSHEIGTRMALGPQIQQIRALVVGQSMKLVAAGIAIGIPASLVPARFFPPCFSVLPRRTR
jgi:ABC-type antimicrobial peptide transport system permease subunit